MCTNSNYRYYAIDPDDWDKYVVTKFQTTDITGKEPDEQRDTTSIDSSLVNEDESFSAYNRLSIGTKSW